MMSRRRSLFTFGTLLAAAVLLAPATALAQLADLAIMPTDPPSFDKLKLTWTVDNNVTTEGYRIYYQVQGDTAADPTQANHTGSMDVSGRATKEATLGGLMPNTKYRAAIVVLDANDVAGTTLVQSSSNSTATLQEATTAQAGAPAPPRNVTATGGDGTFMVMWEAPYPGEAGLTIKEYRVQKREVAGGLFGDWIPTEEKGSDYKGGMKVAGDMTMVTFDGLKNGTTYQARVRATNSADVVGDYSIRDGDTNTPGDEAAMVGDDGMTETPALPLVGILMLGAGLVAAGRRRLRQ